MMFKVWGYGDTGQQYAQLNIVRGFAGIGLSFVARGPSIISYRFHLLQRSQPKDDVNGGRSSKC